MRFGARPHPAGWLKQTAAVASFQEVSEESARSPVGRAPPLAHVLEQVLPKVRRHLIVLSRQGRANKRVRNRGRVHLMLCTSERAHIHHSTSQSCYRQTGAASTLDEARRLLPHDVTPATHRPRGRSGRLAGAQTRRLPFPALIRPVGYRAAAPAAYPLRIGPAGNCGAFPDPVQAFLRVLASRPGLPSRPSVTLP